MSNSAFIGGAGLGGASVTLFTSQTSVTVTHNFNTYPIVDVTDENGAVLVPLTITHNSATPALCTATTVTFDVSKSGRIVLSYGAVPGATGAAGAQGPAGTIELWASLTGSYASANTFTFTGTNKDVSLIQMSLFTCTDSSGSTRRIGYVKSSVNNSGTITATVVTDTDLVSGDKDFKIAYARKINDYQHLISIPGEIIADASYSQGVWMQDLPVDSYLLPVDASVLIAAAGSGAALAFNIYKNTTALFGTAPDMTTNTVLRSQRPTTKTLTAAENISLRITSSAGATNKAADFQAKLFIVPQSLFTAF